MRKIIIKYSLLSRALFSANFSQGDIFCDILFASMGIELQIRGGIKYNSKIIFLLFHKNISCDPSLEPSQLDGSNEGSQDTF